MRVKILIIDDYLVSQFATRYAVEQAISNTEIMVSDNSIGALALLSDMVTSGKGFPDIIFVDLIMPKMSGWEFIDITQKTFANMGQTRIYILSAFNNSLDRKRAMDHVAIEGYFNKPITKTNIDSIFT
ncbi:response regulator [Maribacter litoralis]|uniref:response regulator n=1 Tax=Maribacter litoralis TaxID=2059726 RepID=UPI0013DEF4AD|nr:response regulator [Maribacter litoralis]